MKKPPKKIVAQLMQDYSIVILQMFKTEPTNDFDTGFNHAVTLIASNMIGFVKFLNYTYNPRIKYSEDKQPIKVCEACEKN